MVEIAEGIDMAVTPRVQRKVEKISGDDHYPTDDFIKELPSDIAPTVWIPRGNIFGRQNPNEYEERKKLLAVKAFEEDPEGFLIKEPIIACLVPSDNENSRVVIIDGHHRFRESGRLRIRDGRGEKYLYSKVACRVFTPEEMAVLFNKSGHTFEDANGKRPYTADLVIEKLNDDVDKALEQFDQRMPKHKLPKTLEGVTDVKKVEEKFSQPPAQFVKVTA